MLSQDANVLDMACGCGKATVDLRGRVTAHVTGFDIDRQMLEQAQKVSQERGFYDIRYVQGDASQPGAFEPGTFDAITVCAAIHWMVKANATDTLHQLLKPQGKLIIVGGRMGKDDPPGVILGRDVPKHIISQVLKREIVYEDLNGDDELKKHRFERVELKDFRVVEEYTFQQACARVKSVGFFAELQASDKELAWPSLEAAVKEKFVSGIDVPLRMERTVRCFVYKPV